ncbi:LysR family transcriptional regulator [Amorphoplanes nipponensis]|uniref:Transcriptional regulator, LysR family protein n=1 Tax=Actinoplanes nipponensis TaxID=135950 RepID=A0A919JCY5_9ACTN|nr:LysR family transcriptional regulator [Actinoplanes nipponensis]GIE47297.1 putative transcriptional regulator, LysR family protein [Actinoplanes nipponensis]
MDLDLARLRAFVVTADELSFTRAAEFLGIAQPSLSERIRRLEDDLAVTLFSRERRQITLTRAGQELLRRARPLLAGADRIVAEVRAAAREGFPAPRLVLTTLAAGIDELKAGIVVALREKAPDLMVTLTPVSFSDHLRVLRDGTADAAFVWPPYSSAGLTGLHVEPIRDFPRLLALPSGHPAAAAGSADLATVARLPQIPLVEGVDPVFAATWRLVPDPPLAPVPPVDTVGALLAAVAAGHGCAPVPALLARTAVRPDLTFVALSDAPPATLAVAWRRDGADERHRILARVAAG